ncbi:MAG: DMT family protein [Bacteroidales bacterium]|nr:DMT family protein [Bacteroidales bacterium]
MWKIITSPQVVSVFMLVVSNLFMTYAWYGHLKNMSNKAWYVAAIVSWLIAFFEYMVQVPANRLGYTVYTLPQLKIIQEVISLSVFIPFAMIVMNQPFKTNYIWACLCLVGAVYFMFKN